MVTIPPIYSDLEDGLLLFYPLQVTLLVGKSTPIGHFPRCALCPLLVSAAGICQQPTPAELLLPTSFIAKVCWEGGWIGEYKYHYDYRYHRKITTVSEFIYNQRTK